MLPALLGVAQQFPVQVTPQLLPPYSLQVSEYYSPGAAGSKLNLLLLLRDFYKPTLQVRLRMSIESQGIAIRSREDVVYTPITIEAGIPKYIEPNELAPYFNSNNLQFSGITQQQYEQTGKLPEGFYTFCFEVIETSTNQVVSNKGCTFAWITLNEPPMLNIPRKAEERAPSTPQNILFQWTPRHTASPTAAFVTDYIFTIVELPDNAISPEAAFLSNPPLFVDSTAQTTYLYDVTKPPLIEGKKYAWRVQAKAKNGAQDLAMFRNNGYSETFWFTYQNTCAAPTGIAANPQGQLVNITWTNNVDHLEYKVEYREKNNPDAEWFEISNTIPRVAIHDLKPGTVYEYRVGGACEYGQFTFSALNQFTTNNELATIVPDCGTDPGLTATTDPLLQTMNPGDTIKAGDFDVIATQVSGQGSFTGQGYVAVSWLANMKLAVRFTNIQVATDKKLKVGVIETTYDQMEVGIEDVDEVITIIKDLAGLINDLLTINISADKEYFDALIDQLTKIIHEELPHDLKEKFEAVVESLDSAKAAYDSLQNVYDQLPPGAERDAVMDSMGVAKEKFINAQNELPQLNKQRERLVNDIIDVIVTAVKQIQKDFQYTDISNLVRIRDSLRIQIFVEQELEDSVENSTLEIFEIDSMVEDLPGHDNDYATFSEKVKEYEEVKSNLLKNKLFEILFDVFGSSASVNKNVKEDELFNGRILIRTLMEKLDKNESKQSLVKFTVQFLRNAIDESARVLTGK